MALCVRKLTESREHAGIAGGWWGDYVQYEMNEFIHSFSMKWSYFHICVHYELIVIYMKQAPPFKGKDLEGYCIV
jgi:hypothetical protein